MTTTVTNRKCVFENFSASGTIYVTLDNQLAYRHRFENHVQVNIVYDHTGEPVTKHENLHSTSLISDVFTDYSSECCSSITGSTHILPVLHDKHIKPDTSSGYVNSIPLLNLCDQVPSSTVVEAVDHMKDSISDQMLSVAGATAVEAVDHIKDCISEDTLIAGALNYDSVLADADRACASERKIECEPEYISEQKSLIDVDDMSVEESSFEGSKLTSKRLSWLSLKISRQATNSSQKNLRNKHHDVKVNKGKTPVKKGEMKVEHSDKEPPTRSLARLKRASGSRSDKLARKTNRNISDKPKINNRETKNRQRASKVRKLELEKEVKCEYCLQVFKSQQDFFDHRKCDRNSFECRICGKVIPFKAHLLVHMRKHDNSLQEELLPLKELDKTKPQNSELTPANSGSYRGSKHIQCEMCGLIVSNIPILKTHMMIHTGEFAYKCCICGEKTHSIAKQSSHMVTHLRSGKVECKICNIRFETRSELSRHQLKHEFKCSICDEVFPNKTSRMFHYKMAHKDDILRCEVCGKLFSSEEELAPHLKYHRNRAKTQCTICGLFVTRLDNHILSHSQRSEDSKMYVCDQCPKQFKQKLSFQRHIGTHSEEKPYTCMECPKRFGRSGGLRRHMLIHTQEKPFICSICGKACSQMGNLRIHMQTHKGCSLFQCKFCNEHFPYKNSLQEHMETTHFVERSSQDPSRNVTDVTQLYYL